jgi:hypothetical protein
MAALGTFAENLIINALLRNTSFVPPTTVWLALYTTTVTYADTGTEVSGGAYTRMPITFSAPSGGVCTNNTLITFPTASASWGTVTWAAIRDAATAGNLLFYGPLVSSRTVLSGDVLNFLATNVSITVS